MRVIIPAPKNKKMKLETRISDLTSSITAHQLAAEAAARVASTHANRTTCATGSRRGIPKRNAWDAFGNQVEHDLLSSA